MNKSIFALVFIFISITHHMRADEVKNDIHSQRILVLDFGCQYTQLIARRVREIGVYCELHPYDMSAEDIVNFNPNGIILSGGPETVTTHDTPRANHGVAIRW